MDYDNFIILWQVSCVIIMFTIILKKKEPGERALNRGTQ
jgi:hypothetical protein